MPPTILLDAARGRPRNRRSRPGGIIGPAGARNPYGVLVIFLRFVPVLDHDRTGGS